MFWQCNGVFQKRCCGYSSHFFQKHGQKSTFLVLSEHFILSNPISLVDEYSVCKWSKGTFGNCTNVSGPLPHSDIISDGFYSK